MARTTVLVIDPDERARARARDAFERGDMEVVEAVSHGEGIRALYARQPDLVAVDPADDATQVLGDIRAVSDVPLVVVSARGGEQDKVRALRAGADDYLTKPFGADELLARGEAIRRRVGAAASGHAERYSDRSVEIDFAAVEARANGTPLALTPLEFRLLATFTRHPNRVLSVERLLELVWGQSGGARQRVKVYVGYLRTKFREAGVSVPIDTVRGFGYRYRSDG